MRQAAFLFLLFFVSISGIAQVRQDTTRRPTRTKQLAPQTEQEQSRTGSSVVDDSTRNVYGPHTTRWTTEREMFTAKTNLRTLDTTINNYHRWAYVQKSGNFYQDLGNNGTALNPIFPTLPSTIGASAGFNAFAPYWIEELKMYDTKSPYTRIYVVWGGEGRAATRIEFSRNINPRWNFSFTYRPILTDKQILRSGRADRHVISHYYDFYTHYTTKDDRYRIVASYQRIRHRVIENGGINFQVANPEDSLYENYFSTAVNPNLTRANSYEQHNRFHLFHQYNIGKIQAYHVAELEGQVNWFRDDLSADPVDYFDWDRFPSVSTVLDSTRFNTQQHQLGIKGQIGKNNNLFYNGWAKLRSYRFWNNQLSADTLALPGRALEKYIGGELQYALDSVQRIVSLIEVLDGGYSRIESTGNLKWFDFTAMHRISKPTFLQTAYSGRFDLWDNDFRSVESLYLSAFPKIKTGPLVLSPGLSYTSFNVYIYFTKRNIPNVPQTVFPVQTSSPVSYATPEVRMDLTLFKSFHFRPQVLYSRVLADADSVLRIPELFVNGQLAWEGDLFQKALQVQIGVDVHWRSSYKPMGYDVVTQTFYNQDDVKPPAYLLGDVFLNGKIKRGRFFIKYHNLAQRFTGVGYMPTPYYRGVPSILDFGFELMLFD